MFFTNIYSQTTFISIIPRTANHARVQKQFSSGDTASFEIPKKVFGGFDNVFDVYLMRGFQKYERSWILTMAFWVTCKIARSTFLPCLSLPSKSQCENSISSILVESPHLVYMKKVVKSSKHFFGYFNTLETHSEVYENLCLTL